jgi:hypothetical protein
MVAQGAIGLELPPDWASRCYRRRMIRLMSDEEIRESEEKVRSLYASPDLEDQVVAILMDMSVGGHGDHEHSARAKARAILSRLQTH